MDSQQARLLSVVCQNQALIGFGRQIGELPNDLSKLLRAQGDYLQVALRAVEEQVDGLVE